MFGSTFYEMFRERRVQRRVKGGQCFVEIQGVFVFKSSFLYQFVYGFLVNCLIQWNLERRISCSLGWDEGGGNQMKLGGCMVSGKGRGFQSWVDVGIDFVFCVMYCLCDVVFFFRFCCFIWIITVFMFVGVEMKLLRYLYMGVNLIIDINNFRIINKSFKYILRECRFFGY